MIHWFWNRAKEDLSEELESHLRMAIEERVANGESPAQARGAALREFGNVPLIQDVTRGHQGWLWLEDALQDARYALRQFRRAPAFVATVLLTIAIGIGVNLAVFQLLYGVILAKLPVAHPEELVVVHAARTPFDQAWMVSYAAYQRLRASTESDAPLCARASANEAILEHGNESIATARYEMVSDNYFSVLTVAPAAGRFFVQADAREGQGEWPAVVRFDFARDTFGSAQQALGQHIVLNKVPFVIVGVTNKRFLGVVTGYPPDLWVPLETQSTGHLGVAFDSLGPGHDVDLDKPWHNQPTIFWLSLIARVPAGHRNSAVNKWNEVFQADRVLMSAATEDPKVKSAFLRTTVQLAVADRGLGGIREQSSLPLALLMALSASIFLVGCLNLANLQIARLNTRAQELSVRIALGASRWRLLRQILMEDALLVLFGGASAFLVGRTASAILVGWASSRNSLLKIDLHPNPAIAAVGVALIVFTLVAFSILPALHFLGSSLAQAAGSRARVAGAAHSRPQRWRSNMMLAAQVSLSLLLASMSGCFAATLIHWETIDVGMDREHILSIFVDMQRTEYANYQKNLPELYRMVKERLEALPEVRSAAVEMCSLPDCGWNTALYVFGRSGLSSAQVHGKEDHVGPGFFSTMGIPLLRGRDFSSADTAKTQKVAIVSEGYARHLFGNEDPLGHWVGYEPAPNDHKFLIVGEVADARVDGPQFEPPPVVYMSVAQIAAPIHAIQIRAAGSLGQLAERVRATLHQVDPNLPIEEIVPFDAQLNDGLGTEKLLARLAAVYASLTLLLVAIGFYGVMSSRTARRRSEFGIRLALGATRRNIQTMIVGQTIRILLAGVAPGLLLSWAAMRLSRHLLVGSMGTNSLAAIGATILLALAGAFATLIPARRAALTDPLETLRSE